MSAKTTNTTIVDLGTELVGRFPCLEFHSGYLFFIPAKSMRDAFSITKAPFSPGAYLEFRIQMGDEFFEGDGAQKLEESLWVVESNGSRHLLARGYFLYMNLRKAALNLKSISVPLKVVKAYDGPNGKHVESEIPIDTSRSRLSVVLLVGTSSLWLGAIAGLFVHGVWPIAAVGISAFIAIAVATICLGTSKRVAMIRTLMLLPSYTAGFVISVLVARHLVAR